MRVLYFYLMRNAPDRVRTAVPDHAEYWGTLGVHAYLGGPFADRSGGLITFEVASIDEAKRLVAEVRGSSSRPSAVEACGILWEGSCSRTAKTCAVPGIASGRSRAEARNALRDHRVRRSR